MKQVKSFSVLFSLRFSRDFLEGGGREEVVFSHQVQDVQLLLSSGKFVE